MRAGFSIFGPARAGWPGNPRGASVPTHHLNRPTKPAALALQKEGNLAESSAKDLHGIQDVRMELHRHPITKERP
jgi:hypothetical protein